MADRLFPELAGGSERVALRFGSRQLSYGDVAAAIAPVVRAWREGGRPGDRIAVWATPTAHTAVAVLACLAAGIPAVPINPTVGERELDHIVTDSAPTRLLVEADVTLPDVLGALPRQEIALDAPADDPDGLPPEPAPDSAAFVVYTSGTTGAPKGVVLPRRAIAATVDAVADAWAWTGDDVLTHGLPLFHVHGLILGVLGPLRLGGSLHHLGKFSTAGAVAALNDGATMLFGVPTMYYRLAEELDTNADAVRALRGARLLVSGSAALPVREHERIAAATGRRVVERYGMTETLMNTSVRVDSERPPGTVGWALPGVDLRLVDDAGTPISAADGDTVGEIQVRGPNLFTEYLNRPDATAAAFDGDWFRTGDMAVREPDGCVRIVGRRTSDLIKSGGYRIGAGEIENALLEHPAVAEAAVTGEPDPDLGERIVAWVVPRGRPPQAEELTEHVARLLTPHKRPRRVCFLESLPRNDMGKVMKRALTE